MSFLAKIGNFLNTPNGLLLVLLMLIGILILGALIARKVVSKYYKGQFLTLLALIYLSLIFFIITYSFRKAGKVTAAVVPRLWIFGLLGCCIYLLMNIFRGNESKDPEGGSLIKPLVYIGMCLIYIILMPFLGFFIASFIFLITSFLFLNYHRWRVIFLISIAWIAFNYFIFYKLFYVSFPQGVIINI
ncbi:MAG TPA: tripartite tricarboxylate transporter TctB family protein [Rectinema sp.]|nr:tripartite tricarboxylate transporter TctB family protein [Rectinema sp.]